MGAKEVPKWFPYSIYIAAYHVESEKELKSQSIAEKLYHRYGGEYSKDLDSLDFRSGSVSIYVRGLLQGGSEFSLSPRDLPKLKRRV
jgi:hypothetical protein